MAGVCTLRQKLSQSDDRRENQLPEAHRLVHDAPHGSVSGVATYPQLTCRAIDVGA
jgi:hypothetical protein